MVGFNKESRKKNAVLISSIGVLNQIISNVAAFIYRTVFIYWLSVEYLGLNGLFSNVIQIFSLAELGIGSVITFRMYKPIKEDDVDRTAALMRFYKMFYRLMAVMILVIGAVMAPFIPYVINDASEIPSDINIYVIYALYILQSATSYTFAYRQSLLEADQKGYINTSAQMIFTCIRYAASILVLYLTRNYTLVLAAGLAINLLANIWIYGYVGRKYKEVIQNKTKLSKAEILQICKDTGAMMCHRIGTTVVNSTDNIIMSMYVGTVAVGIYSNYSMIIRIIQNTMSNLLGSFTASIGNHALSVQSEERYLLFKKLQFANMWLAVFCTSSLYLLLNPFIQVVWGEELVFSKDVVFILCINFFLFSSRAVNGAFSNASGMFRYDRVRPLIEAALNLIISVVLAERIGVAGVFLGTIISSALTVWWREPYLLYTKLFNKKLKGYFVSYILWTGLLFIITVPLEKMFSYLPVNMLYLIVRFLICGIGINAVIAVLMCRNPNFVYFLDFGKNLIRKKMRI